MTCSMNSNADDFLSPFLAKTLSPYCLTAETRAPSSWASNVISWQRMMHSWNGPWLISNQDITYYPAPNYVNNSSGHTNSCDINDSSPTVVSSCSIPSTVKHTSQENSYTLPFVLFEDFIYSHVESRHQVPRCRRMTSHLETSHRETRIAQVVALN